MRKLHEYIGQQFKKSSSYESSVALELVRLIRTVSQERRRQLRQIRALKERVLGWTQGRVKRECQLYWDCRVRESLLALEENRRSEIERLPHVLEKAVLRLAGEVCSEIVERPDWLSREIDRLIEYLKANFPYLNSDDRNSLVITVGKGSDLSKASRLPNGENPFGSIMIKEDETLRPGDLRIMSGKEGLAISRAKLIEHFKT